MTEPPRRKRDYPGQWNFGKGDWRCDFCNRKNAPEMWFYPHKPFEFFFVPFQKVIVYKDEALAACEPCHQAIAADNYTQLVMRSMDSVKAHAGVEPPQMRDLLSRAYNLFRANRTTADPVRITKQG